MTEDDEKRRLDRIEDAYVFGPSFDATYIPRWLYALMLIGSMVAIGLLGWGWR